MYRFRKFLADIRWAWPVFIAAFLIIGIVSYFDYQSDSNPHRGLAAMYGNFCKECLPNHSADNSFKEELTKILKGDNPDERLKYLKAFVDEREREHRELFFGLDSNTVNILLSDQKEQIQPLINRELKSIKMPWLSVLSWAWIFWKIATVISLVIFWWESSYLMSYFPYKKWWFYLYGILAYPWSLIIALVLVFHLMLKGIQTLIFLHRSRRAREPYQEFCQIINSRLDDTRKRWVELFSGGYIHRVLPELRYKRDGLRRELEGLNSAVQIKSQEYFRYKNTVSKLEDTPDSLDKSEIELLMQKWSDEFDKLRASKYVKAIEIEDRYLRIYTDVFRTFFGRFGPVKVEIDLLKYDNYSVVPYAHTSSIVQSNTGAYRDHFCFGNRYQTIKNSLGAGRIEEAFLIMCDSFQSSGIQ